MNTYPEGYIYAIENTLDTNVYIGSTIKPIGFRFKQHIRSAKRSPQCTFHKYMALHGCDNFFITCLHTEYNVSICKLQMLERSYIQGYGSLNTVHSKSDVVVSDDVLNKVGRKTRKTVFETEMPDITLDLIFDVTEECDELLSLIELRDRIFDDTSNMSKAMAEMCSSEKISITKGVLEWLGYDSEKDYDNKASFIKLLKTYVFNFITTWL